MTSIKALAKRFFVLPYILLCTAASLHCAWQLLWGQGFNLSWLGAWLAVTPVPIFVVMLYGAAFPQPGRFIVIQLITAMVGAALVVVQMDPLPTLYALSLGLGGVLLYVFWYSYLDRHDNALLRVGQSLPTFSLLAEDGTAVSSQQFTGRKTVYLFFRGSWCPLCRSQLSEFREHCRQFTEQGLKVVLISPQAVAQSRELLGELPEGVELYSDPSLSAAKALHIFHALGMPFGVAGGPDTVLPSLLMVDEAGVIRYVDLPENFRIGPQPTRLLSALEENWL